MEGFEFVEFLVDFVVIRTLPVGDIVGFHVPHGDAVTSIAQEAGAPCVLTKIRHREAPPPVIFLVLTQSKNMSMWAPVSLHV